MRIPFISFLTTCVVFTDASGMRRKLQDGFGTEAPAAAMGNAFDTPQPTEQIVLGGGNEGAIEPAESPMSGGQGNTNAPLGFGGEDQTETPKVDLDMDGNVQTNEPGDTSTSAPVESPAFGQNEGSTAPTESPTDEGEGNANWAESPSSLGNDDTPTPSPGLFSTVSPSPTFDFDPIQPTGSLPESTPPPTIGFNPVQPTGTFPMTTPFPTADYNPPDDDPFSIAPEDNAEGAWDWNDSELEDIEHDRTVLIALLSVFGVMALFAICVAHQTIENPHGCCASICRIFVACTCCITRCVCYPCRWVCGCTRSERRTHDMMLSQDVDYTHDLELS